MKATDLFPDEIERRSVRRTLLEVDGVITRVTEPDGTIIYENNSYEQRRKLCRS